MILRHAMLPPHINNVNFIKLCNLNGFRNRLMTTAITGLKSLREQSAPHQKHIADVVLEEQTKEEERSIDDYILCRQCHQIITSETERMAIQGSHLHTFANPNGIVFEIGCFEHSIGCAFSGHSSMEFTWFAGFSWRIAVCGMCLTHMGWLFESTGGRRFHGLILDRLLR